MRFTPRMRQIFQVLLKEPSAISVRQLAEQIGVSRRTVQRELEYISTPLNEYGLTFVSKTGVGIWIEGKEEDKQQLLADSMEGDGYDVGNREERRKRLILEILKEKGSQALLLQQPVRGQRGHGQHRSGGRGRVAWQIWARGRAQARQRDFH